MKALTLSNLICLVGMRNKPSSVRPPSRRDMIERASGLAILRLHAFKWSTRSSPKIGLIVVSWSIPREKSKEIPVSEFYKVFAEFFSMLCYITSKEIRSKNTKQEVMFSGVILSCFSLRFFTSDLFCSNGAKV